MTTSTDELKPCPHCGIKIRARHPGVARLMCPKRDECQSAHRCAARASSSPSASYCELHSGHEGAHKNGIMYWSGL